MSSGTILQIFGPKLSTVYNLFPKLFAECCWKREPLLRLSETLDQEKSPDTMKRTMLFLVFINQGG